MKRAIIFLPLAVLVAAVAVAVTAPASPDGSAVKASSPTSLAESFGTLIDPVGNNWAVKGGVIYENGVAQSVTQQVTELLLCKGVIYQQASKSALWWKWTGTPPAWAATTNPSATCPLSPPSSSSSSSSSSSGGSSSSSSSSSGSSSSNGSSSSSGSSVTIGGSVKVVCPVSVTSLIASINTNMQCAVSISNLSVTTQ